MTISCAHCPKCKIKLQAKESRIHHKFGFSTVKRRRSCPKCDFRITTVEVPMEIANEVFSEDE